MICAGESLLSYAYITKNLFGALPKRDEQSENELGLNCSLNEIDFPLPKRDEQSENELGLNCKLCKNVSLLLFNLDLL